MTREQCVALATEILEFLFGFTDDAIEIATRVAIANTLGTMLYTKINLIVTHRNS